MPGWTAPDWYIRDCAKIGQLARRVGGYEEMIRLHDDLAVFQKKYGKQSKFKIIIDKDGKHQIALKEYVAPPPPLPPPPPKKPLWETITDWVATQWKK